MFETIKRLYLAGALSEAGIRRAADRGWISDAQMCEILSKE